MAKDPAFLFYTNDFQSGTLFFSDEQLGKYLRLLMAQHQHGHLSEKQVLFICKTKDEDIMSKFVKDADGLYYNEKLESVINSRAKFSESRRNNRLGKKKDIPKDEDLNNTSYSYEKHMENEDEIENKDENNKGDKPKIFVPDFESYPITYRQGLKTWWDYKAEKKQKYKPKGWETFVESAMQDFPDAVKFNEALKHSISNNYSGLYAKGSKAEVTPPNMAKMDKDPRFL